MADITNLIITRKSAVFWEILANGSSQTKSMNLYYGVKDGDYITILSANGAITFHRVYFGVIQYVDDTDPTNNMLTPSSASEIFSHLLDENFFVGGSGSGGGSGSATTFKALLDVRSIGGFVGKAGNIFIVSDNEQYLEPIFYTPISIFQDLENWLGPRDLIPDQYILTDSTGSGLISAPLSNIINRPALFDEFQNIRKGWTYNDRDGYRRNGQQYANEIGDFFRFMKQNEDGVPIIYEARWNGGDMNDLDNWVIYKQDTVILPNEPGYEE